MHAGWCFLVPDKKKKMLFYSAIGLAAVFGILFVFNIYTHIQRGIDTQETRRQNDIIYGVFNFEDELVLAARNIMNNDDIIAHLSISGTSINHAVVQGTDNEFYLYHDLLRQPNSNGSIFLDYLNSPSFTDKSTIIYGHNRNNGTMFHDIRFFQDYEFFADNKLISVTTLEDSFLYEIFAVFTAHISFNYIQVDFADGYEFLALVNEMKDRAMHLRDVTITENDKILIISTCTGVGPTGRLVVVGRLQK
jgi:sortase B